MTEIGRYFTYEEANEWQISLLAADIDARVEMRAPNVAFIAGGTAVFILLVHPEDVEKALPIISPPIAEDYESIMYCPACGSKDVFQRRGLSSLTPILDEMITSKMGTDKQLQCLACSHQWSIL